MDSATSHLMREGTAVAKVAATWQETMPRHATGFFCCAHVESHKFGHLWALSIYVYIRIYHTISDHGLFDVDGLGPGVGCDWCYSVA